MMDLATIMKDPQTKHAAIGHGQCVSDLAFYLESIKHYDVHDVNFAHHRDHHLLRCASILEKIAGISSQPLLHSASMQEKIAFYRAIRANDAEVAAIEGKAIHLVRSATGIDPINVGSFGLLLNLASSDIDLGIGVADVRCFNPVCVALMHSGFKYKQARDTRYIDEERTTKRFVFSKLIDETEIDVSVYHTADLYLLSEGGQQCRTLMSEHERAEHTWNKFTLKENGQSDDYNLYKLEPYIRFKPGFKWVAIG